MEIPAKCLNSYFILPFCWLAFVLEIDFLSSVPFFSALPSCLRLLEEAERAAGGFRLHLCSKCRVCQAETWGTAQLWEDLQEESEQGTGMKLLHSPTQHRLSACKSARLSNRLSVCFYCLYVAKCIVPFLLFTFSHSQPPPLCSPLFVPHWLSLIRLCWSLCACRWDCHGYYCHGYCDLLWGWQRGWKP